MVAIIRFQSLSKFDAYNTMVVFICGQNILNRDEANTDDIHSIVFFYVTWNLKVFAFLETWIIILRNVKARKVFASVWSNLLGQMWKPRPWVLR